MKTFVQLPQFMALDLDSRYSRDVLDSRPSLRLLALTAVLAISATALQTR